MRRRVARQPAVTCVRMSWPRNCSLPLRNKPKNPRGESMGRFSGRIMAAALSCAVAVSALFAGAAQAADPIKIGVLHSLSGTMAISETTLKDTILMMVDDLNKKGGLLGRPVEAVVVDPASNWPLFAEKAR